MNGTAREILCVLLGNAGKTFSFILTLHRNTKVVCGFDNKFPLVRSWPTNIVDSILHRSYISIVI